MDMDVVLNELKKRTEEPTVLNEGTGVLKDIDISVAIIKEFVNNGGYDLTLDDPNQKSAMKSWVDNTLATSDFKGDFPVLFKNKAKAKQNIVLLDVLYNYMKKNI